MKIDRRRFYTLTTAMAATHATHCMMRAPPPVVAVPVDVSDAGSPTEIASDDDANAAAAAPVAKAAPPPLASASVEGDPHARKTAINIVGQPCAPAENAKGVIPSCAPLKAPGPTCEGFDHAKTQCSSLGKMWKPRVAERAAKCHLDHNGRNELCEWRFNTDCVQEALSSVCIEPTAAAFCKPLVSKCSGPRGTEITHDSCVAAMSAIQDSKRSRFISCVTEFCHVEDCLTDYAPTKEGSGNAWRKPLFKP